MPSFADITLAVTSVASSAATSTRSQKTLPLNPTITREGNTQASLICRNQEIGILPPELGKLKALKLLDFSDNLIWELPINSLMNLSCLEGCYLSHNQLETVPREICYLTALETLYLSHNKIRSLPESIRYCKELSKLYVCHNQIQTLPFAFLELRKLVTLSVGVNPLQLPPLHICVSTDNVSQIVDHLGATRRHTCPWCGDPVPLQSCATNSLSEMRKQVSLGPLLCGSCGRSVAIAGRYLPTVPLEETPDMTPGLVYYYCLDLQNKVERYPGDSVLKTARATPEEAKSTGLERAKWENHSYVQKQLETESGQLKALEETELDSLKGLFRDASKVLSRLPRLVEQEVATSNHGRAVVTTWYPGEPVRENGPKMSIVSVTEMVVSILECLVVLEEAGIAVGSIGPGESPFFFFSTLVN